VTLEKVEITYLLIMKVSMELSCPYKVLGLEAKIGIIA